MNRHTEEAHLAPSRAAAQLTSPVPRTGRPGSVAPSSGPTTEGGWES